MFRNDYSLIGDDRILEALIKYKDEENIGYGEDYHSINASNLIRKCFNLNDNASIFFLNGGTQSNMSVISYLLRPYEAVIACDTGHINVHETGAVEGSGHKILTIKNNDGKLNAKDIEELMKPYTDDHMVKPKMVYISDSTETGSIYTKQELEDIRDVCDRFSLYLFIDGARLAVALTSNANDVKKEFIADISDCFYIGGTKNGLPLGEAIVFKNKELAKDFRKHIKNKGAMNAKGFVLGIMFERLFGDNLYFDLAKNSNEQAELIRNKLNGHVKFASNSTTNQIFIEMDKNKALKVIEKYGCELWSDNETSLVFRIVTSFKTKESESLELVNYILSL